MVTTLAGSPGVWGSTDGAGSNALFNGPSGIAVDGSTNIFVADANNHTIRKITPAGGVTTFAGRAGEYGTNDGTGGAALFGKPGELKMDRNNNLYVVDAFNHTSRKITANAVVTTVAGLAGSGGSANGLGAQARFFNPYGLAIDHNGNLRVADTYNETIRFVYNPITAALSPTGNGGFVISWEVVPGDIYQVQFKDTANGVAWQNLGNPVTAAGSTGTLTDTSPITGQRLYRVLLLP